jgi:hypothetical protein
MIKLKNLTIHQKWIIWFIWYFSIFHNISSSLWQTTGVWILIGIQPHACCKSLKLWTRLLPLLLFLNSKKNLCGTFFTSHLTMFNFPFVLHSQHCFFCLKMHGALNSLVHFDVVMYIMRVIQIGGWLSPFSSGSQILWMSLTW